MEASDDYGRAVIDEDADPGMDAVEEGAGGGAGES